MGPYPGKQLSRKRGGGKRLHDPETVRFPHFSSFDPRMCMCLDSCCQNDSGCTCTRCPCQIGISHEEASKLHTVKREETGKSGRYPTRKRKMA